MTDEVTGAAGAGGAGMKSVYVYHFCSSDMKLGCSDGRKIVVAVDALQAAYMRGKE